MNKIPGRNAMGIDQSQRRNERKKDKSISEIKSKLQNAQERMDLNENLIKDTEEKAEK